MTVAGDDRRRRTRMRLRQGQGRICLGDPQSPIDDGVYGPMQHRRLLVGAHVAGVPAAGRRFRARARLIAAAATRWGVAPDACVARNGSVYARGLGPLGRLRRTAPSDAAKISLRQEPAIKTPEQFKLIGTTQPRLRHAGESQRRRQIRHRYALARHGLCGGRQLSGVRRQGEELRRSGDQGPARLHRRRARRKRGGGRRRPVLARQGDWSPPCRSSGTKAPPRRPTANNFAPIIAPRLTANWSTRPDRGDAAAALRGRAQDRRSGLRSACISPTRRWSR